MKFGLQMRQTQRLVMTPKLQQALKLLQVPTLELQQILKQEILQNPLLEEVEDIEEDEEELGADATTTTAEPEAEAPAPEAPEAASDSDEPPVGEKEPDESWDEYLHEGFDLGYKRSEDQQEEFFERVPVARTSFVDSLLGQLRILTSDAMELRIGEYLIGSLNDSGYLTCSLVEVANTFKVEESLVARVLGYIQSMEPVGIGARSLQEALLIQLRHRKLGDSVAAEIVRDHFEALKQRKYTEIAKKLHISVEEVQEHANVIRDLDPKPGFELMTDEVRYITPDLIVERVGEEYVVFLNDKNIPRLRISNAYKRELDRSPTNGNKETRDFILGRLSSARWLIQTIEQRRKTMVKVMECIVDEQRDFFEKGPGFLRPLTLQQVASRIGMHESTVSRVTTNKYVQTPRGVFELKYFFSSSLDTEDGDEVSAKAAKTRILDIIGKEDARRPLSDQKIADILKQDGLIIARRTVAKYREQLKILPARLRKQY